MDESYATAVVLLVLVLVLNGLSGLLAKGTDQQREQIESRRKRMEEVKNGKDRD